MHNVRDLRTDRGITFAGNQTSLKEFDIPGAPIDTGYVMLQVADVHGKRHEIRALDIIDPDILREDRNTIQILRESGYCTNS